MWFRVYVGTGSMRTFFPPLIGSGIPSSPKPAVVAASPSGVQGARADFKPMLKIPLRQCRVWRVYRKRVSLYYGALFRLLQGTVRYGQGRGLRAPSCVSVLHYYTSSSMLSATSQDIKGLRRLLFNACCCYPCSFLHPRLS